METGRGLTKFASQLERVDRDHLAAWMRGGSVERDDNLWRGLEIMRLERRDLIRERLPICSVVRLETGQDQLEIRLCSLGCRARRDREAPRRPVRYTRVDGIELLDFHSQIEKANYGAGRSPALRVLPSSGRFGPGLPIVKRDEFRAAQRFMSDASSRGFKITCNFVPMWSGSEEFTRTSLVDATGGLLTGPGDFPVHGCPNNPEMLRFGEFMMRHFVRAWPDMDVMALNHLEYPWRVSWDPQRWT